jgi:hypothetical protein
MRWSAWVRLWSHVEAPWSLALVRLLLGVSVVGDLLQLGFGGLIDAVFVPESAGGLLHHGETWWWAILGADITSGRALYACLLLAHASVALGFFTRSASVVALLLSAQFGLMHPDGDRGIDMLIRNVLMVFAFSRAGAAWSVDARWATGSWRAGAP